MTLPAILLAALLSGANAALPLVDFDRMGKVGIAGAFAGLDLFANETSSFSFDSSTSSLLSRDSAGALSPIASTNSGGRILSGCALSDTFYLAGTFTSIGSVNAANIASYTPSTGAFSALGSNGPNGEIDTVFCDSKNNKIWVGGKFSSPGASVAVWDTKASSWSQPPFNGVSGAASRVLSISTNASASSIFFAGSFIASFGGSAALNGTNNPNVPFSTGASPFSSSLVPVPLSDAQVLGSPSSTDAQFRDIKNTLCPAGDDGPGNSWFAADGNEAVITVRTFSALASSGLRLGNTFQSNHGTKSFSVETLPDNTVRTLKYVDPATGQNATCSNPCPLSSDSSVLYQDFLFDDALSITGVQVKLSEWNGNSAGLHIFQLLSSGAFVSAVDDENGKSCFAPNASSTSRTGTWTAKNSNTDIAGTLQTVVTANVDVGSLPANSPTYTWVPYVSAAGNYDMRLLIPGCDALSDCGQRTSVKITVFPGEGLDPWVTTVSQQTPTDTSAVIYNGPILPTSPEFVTTITMSLADKPTGNGQNGQYELVADRVQLTLLSPNATSGSGSSSGSTAGSKASFGFLEWPLDNSNSLDGTKSFPNSTETFLDTAGFDMLSALGGTSSVSNSQNAIVAVAHHPSGIIYLAGNFTLSSGAASGANNIVAFKDGNLAALADGGLDGPVTSLIISEDTLFVGGSFDNTKSSTIQGGKGIAKYDILQNTWSALQNGLDGSVISLGLSQGKLTVAGSFTKVLTSSTDGVSSAGFATWDIKTSAWVNPGGFLVGNMAIVVNGTTDGQQFVAGNVAASQKFGATGLVMLKNGGSDGPTVTPLGIQLEDSVQTTTSSGRRRRSHYRRGAVAWISQLSIPKVFSRQTTSTLASLPAAIPAPAPAVLAGTFWTNTTSSVEVAIIGGNFSFSAGQDSQGVAIYDPGSSILTALQGPQLEGVARALLVVGTKLYVGGKFTIPGTNANSFAIYDLPTNQWDVGNLQPLQSSDSTVEVRSISTSSSKGNTIIVAGSFANAGSQACKAICFLDATSRLWTGVGGGILGDIASIDYVGDNQDVLIASGSLALTDNTAANVAQFSFANSTWASVGSGADIPGPVTAVAVNARNASSIFAAGKSADGSQSFLSFWDGVAWSVVGSTLESSTSVSQLTMVPLQDSHSGNSVIQSDRMLMVSGSLAGSSFGSASSALFDGQSFIPYISSTSSTGTSGAVSSMFHSFTNFSFSKRHLLATGVVILISIAIGAGVVFLLALIGILWTLFSRKDERINKVDPADQDDDDESTHHRPSSLLEHINAATRTTILGGASPFHAEKSGPSTNGHDNDPFTAEGGNYIRADTPSDAMGGMLAEETSRPAHARYSFDGNGEGELPIAAGQEIEILDDRDREWWYARNVRTGAEGVVPASYLV